MMVYLDNSTTAPPSERSIQAMLPYLTTHWGNPIAPHQRGQDLYPSIENFFRILYRSLGADEADHVILTSSGAEAVNHAVCAAMRDVTLQTGKNHFLTSSADEAAAALATMHLEPFGCTAKTIEVNREGIVTIEALTEALSPRTALLSLSWANGLTGTVQPVVEIAQLCRKRGVRLHLDATHVFGKLEIDLEAIKPDYLSLNGEQLHGPRGSGILYARRGASLSPFIFGSTDQGGLRSGCLNMAALAGLAAAAEEAIDHLDFICTETARLRNKLERGILKRVPGASVCFARQERLPHCTTILFPGVVNEALLFLLNRAGICASVGGGAFQQLQLLLRSCGVDPVLAQSALSFGLSRYTTEEEIDRAIQSTAACAISLQQLSAHDGG